MSWDSYITNLLADGECQDAAIIGYIDGVSIWASTPGKILCNVTPEEIAVLIGKDRASFLTNGLTLGKVKCSVLRDRLEHESEWTMDLRTKAPGQPTYNITVAKAGKALIAAIGHEGKHGGIINTKVYNMMKHLRDSGY
ncbi:profilin-1-like [Acipenser oxyrinchus oxyrinchus]|uniref:Profilin n=1 Tax=Acipenser oxyrinchus oxyrinchus TaxID=40147 RepID=A0AAD8CN81_ACIOX|nr:profilin-1-like [Acipenser oxyrinchus oxyrinchus]KAK1153578.1 profilin-1-like [Acipenser oxyrinchus oxyrinchus]